MGDGVVGASVSPGDSGCPSDSKAIPFKGDRSHVGGEMGPGENLGGLGPDSG